MREVPGNQAARQVPARPESEGRPQLLVPRLPPSGEQEYRQRHGERLNAASRREPIPERTCRTCGQPFMPIRKDQNYCRPWCRAST